MFFLGLAALAIGLTYLLARIVGRLAWHFGIVDEPDQGAPGSRKIHQQTTPLAGGAAIFVAYFSILLVFSSRFLAGDLEGRHLAGFLTGGLILVIGGILDDKFNLRPGVQFLFPLSAVAVLILGGVEIVRLTNPWGGIIDLQPLVLASPVLIAIWLLGMMYTTKLLDGVDGLVSGMGVVGGIIIFLFTLTTRYYQPDIALAALLLAGCSAGFLIINWHPAKIFLGEGGSLLLGYIMGVLAIISGSKIAIALLIMGIPILDVAWTILRRLRQGQNPLRFSDRRHLHHRLLSLGLSQRQTVLVFYGLAAVFGLSGLFLQSRGKLGALAALAALMLLIVIVIDRLDHRRL